MPPSRPAPVRAAPLARGDDRLHAGAALLGAGRDPQRRDTPALIHRGRTISHGELAERVAQRAREFGPGRRVVMIAGANEPEVLISHLAALSGGHVSWPVPSLAQADELRRRFAPDTLVHPEGDGIAIHHLNRRATHRLHPDLALLAGTSGSTGAPRLVRLSHTNIAANAAAIATYLNLDHTERAITSLPPHYCYGLSVVHSHLLAGASLVLSDRSVSDPAFWGLVRENGVTSLAGVPHTFALLEQAGFADLDLPSLRYLTQAGGRMDPERVRRFAALGATRGWELVVMYGQTEATARMAYLPAGLAHRHPHTIGVPIPGGRFTLRAVDDAPAEDVGELIYHGPNVMMGYAETPDDLATGSELSELATGDLARRTPEGLYEIVGRRSRFVKIFGLRIDLARVEALLEADGVEAICTGDDERLAIGVSGGADPAAVAARLAAVLGLPVARIAVVHLARLPRLANGKPDYRAVAAAADERDTASSLGTEGTHGRWWRRRTPGKRPSASVAALYAKALTVPAVAPTDTFAGLGGDSLTYVEVSLGLEELVGALPAGWETMAVERLQALAAESSPTARRWCRVETGVVLRAGAILLVLASHMTDVVPAGGAHLLLALAGFMFARFLLADGADARWSRRAAGAAARIGLPTMAWIGLMMLIVGGYGPGVLLLVNDYTGDPGLRDGDWQYWFIEALVQLLLVAALLFSVPAVRRAERAWPFALPLVLFGFALLFRFDLLSVGDPTRYIFRPHTVAWLFLLGWLIQRATRTRRRLLVSALVLACLPGFFGEPLREAIIAAGLLAVIWLPTVPLPRIGARLIAPVAAASLFIYLTHWQVWPLMKGWLPVPVMMVICVLAGIVVLRVSDRATAWGAIGAHRLGVILSRRRRAVSDAARLDPAGAEG